MKEIQPIATPAPAGEGDAPPCGPDASAIAEIRATLAGGSELAAVEVLATVLRWATEVLRADTLDTSAAAFRAMALADRALAWAPGLFAALNALAARSEPAEQVIADLGRHQAQLAELRRQTAPHREHLTALRRIEERLRHEIADRDEIIAQIGELERIERLAAGMTELRAQRDALEQRTRGLATAVTGTGTGLAKAAARLITLSDEMVDSLADDTRRLLRRAGEQDRLIEGQLAEYREIAGRIAADTTRQRAELAEAEAEAAAIQAQFESAYDQAVRRLTGLRIYAAANRGIVGALAGSPPQLADPDEPGREPALQRAGIPGAMAALDDADRRLAEIDATLGNVLAAHERARQHAGIPLRPGRLSPADASPEGE